MLSSLLSSTIFALFIIIAIGFVVGRIKFKGINLDVSAVIFVALLFGHYGVYIPAELGNFGMVLFIFSIGIQAGPGFFSSFKNKGKELSILAFALIVSASLVTVLMSFVFKFDIAQATGLLTGALTSTPGLATAKEIAGDPAAISYSIAYPFGVIGVILFVKLLPSILKVDLKKEQQKISEAVRELNPDVEAAAFRVTNSLVIGRPLLEMEVRKVTGALISRISRAGVSIIPRGNDCLQKDDLIKCVGTSESLAKIEKMVGERLEGDLPFVDGMTIETVLLTTTSLVGRSIASLNITSLFGCNITRVRRSGIDFAPDPKLTLKFGDKITLVGPKDHMQEVSALLGNQRKMVSDTDFFPIALGVVIGVIVGNITISFQDDFSFSFGLTGGVLLTALMLSAKGKTGNIIWTMSGSANNLLRQIGLLMFLANVGTSAGSTLVDTFMQSGWSLFVAGFCITLLPMVITTIVARYCFKINMLELLGSLTGGMTSTPGLAAADSMCEGSSATSVAYATVYPVAMVLLIVMTQVVAMIVGCF